MCLTSQAPHDNSGDVARQQATDREAKITQGKSSIDNAFGGFNPQFYDQYTKAYTDNYNPEVDRQFGVAKQQLEYGTARRGVTDATEGQKEFGDLTRDYGVQRNNIASQAVDATNKLKSTVDAEKGTLYAQNSASADPSLAAISATTNANALQTPGSYSPLGSLFAGAINGGAQYVQGQRNQLPAGYAAQFAPGASLSGNGSGRVIS